MHEIPNLPFPSLHQPEQTPATQSASHNPETDKRCEDRPSDDRQG